MELTFQVAIFVIGRLPVFVTPAAVPNGTATMFYRKIRSSANREGNAA
jgi:hypothetical protein